jgi:NAD(P)-dependent dehydrogenase (short-subunit alcohol dehydrogenase family)
MEGRVVLISGANGGLGAAVVRRFLDGGAAVVGTARKIQSTDFNNPHFTGIAADLTDPKAVSTLTSEIMSRFGRIDALVHVMGGFAGGKTVAETDDATWMQMQSLNLTSAFYVTRAVVPHMRQAGFGRIVAVGSLTALDPHAGLGAYVTFKAALVTLIRTLALENGGAGITANVVLPGTMDTPANRAAMPNADASKWLQTTDVAEVLHWLASDAAGQVNGAAIPVRGRDV